MTVEEFCKQYYTERRHSECLKWDALDVRFGDKDLLPLWIADMEFSVPACVEEAIIKRARHSVYGYSMVPDSYYEAVIDWEKSHHGYAPSREAIRITPGVVSALYWSVNLYTEPGDAVVVLTPVYYPFQNAVKDSGRKLVTCDLHYENGVFSVDYDAFEQAITENQARLFILCSPHNPVGRVWHEEELDRMLAICARHNVLVVSDEIHQDMVFGEHKHIPAAIVSDGKYAQSLITAFASSKTFNLACCLTSTVVIENEELRSKWDAFTKVYHQVEVNIFGIAAVEAALRGGEDWYQSLKKVVESNYQYLITELASFSSIHIAELEGTYLAFIDLSAYIPGEKIKYFIQDKCHLAVDYGEWFGENWKSFIRLNLATHPKFIREAVSRIKDQLNLQI